MHNLQTRPMFRRCFHLCHSHSSALAARRSALDLFLDQQVRKTKLKQEQQEKRKALEEETKAKRLRDYRKAQERWQLSKTKLTVEQEQILHEIGLGKSVFFTGCAGTGKSHLLYHVVEKLKSQYGEHAVFVTASTGNAACNIQGTTIHYFAGMQPGVATLDERVTLAKRMRKKQWAAAKALVIDEVSMVSGEFLETLNQLAQAMKGKKKVFGGLQVVLCGDFLQLPPIADIDGEVPTTPTFAFEAPCWNELVQEDFELTSVFRQDDPNFIRVLGKVRMGDIDDEVREMLQSRSNVPLEVDHGVTPTQLFPLRKEVNKVNEAALAKLSGDPWCYTAKDKGDTDTLSGCISDNLILKKNSQVVLLWNLDPEAELVNGSRGLVVGFKDGHPIVRFADEERLIKPKRWEIIDGGKVVGSRKQYPLAPSWALSIHKSQGLSLDAVQIGLKNIFEFGQAYVGLSRVRRLQNLTIKSMNFDRFKVHPVALKYHKELQMIFDSRIRRTFTKENISNDH